MGNHQADKKFTWVIKNFSSLDFKRNYSDTFVAGRCKWSLFAFKGTDNYYKTCFSLFICVHIPESLASGWRRHAKFSFTIVNQIPGELSQLREAQFWFDQQTTFRGFISMYSFTELQSRNNGLVVNEELKIVAEVDVLEVIGKLDVPEETTGSIDINGFQVFASQVESVSSLFEKYPGFPSRLCPQNPHLRKACLNVILSLTEILCKSPDELSNDDIADAYSALRYVMQAGFKLDWLEKKLKETGKSRLQEIEEGLIGLKVRCTNMEALLEFLR